MNLNAIVMVAAAMMLFANADLCQAQRRPRKRQPVARPMPFPQPITTQRAVTEDGDTVLLKSDGTWEYYNAPPVVPKLKTQIVWEGTLSLEEGVIFRSGEMKPVAPATFYLLDEYPGLILKDTGIKPDKRVDGKDYDNIVDLKFALGLAMAYPTLPGQQEFLTAAMAAIKPHIVQTMTVDFVRKAQFAAVPVGSYYLMGSAQAPKGMIFWNIAIDIKAGQNSLAIDKQWSVYSPLNNR